MDSGNTEDELRLLPIYPGYVGGVVCVGGLLTSVKALVISSDITYARGVSQWAIWQRRRPKSVNFATTCSG
jgi:hypothetical protein